MNRGVVITGGGAVTPFGLGLEPVAEALRTSSPRFVEVDRGTGYHGSCGARLAGLVGAPDLSSWLPVAVGRRMSPPSRLAVTAARMALRSAGLPEERTDQETAVVLATAFGPASFSERLYRSVVKDGPESASPFLFAECVANAPAAQVAITCGAAGPNITTVQREAGALVALGRGAAEITSGRVVRALVGVVDELPPVAHGVLDRFRALARERAGLPEAPRPFDRRRNGFVASEGATVLVLEEERAARDRGVRPLARLRAVGTAFDASASRVGWGTGVEPLRRGLLRVLDRADRGPRDVSFVVSGASGSVAGDRLEAKLLCAAFGGGPLPPVLAPKSVTGEYGGGLLASLTIACESRPFGPTAGFREADPDLGLTPHMGGPLPSPRAVVASSLAAGGAAVWAVLEAP